MKIQIRNNVFETNSSNVNTLTIMTANEYKDFISKWDDPEWLWDKYEDVWVNITELEDYYDGIRYRPNPCDRYWNNFDCETKEFTTEHGDKIVAVSIYGYDG